MIHPERRKSIGRKSHLKLTYNLTVDEFNDMLAKQGGVCAVQGCGSTNRLCVDHDHKTGKVRAILCNGCNAALGYTRESKPVLSGLIAYIEHYGAQ